MKSLSLEFLFLALIAMAAVAALFHSDPVLNLVGIFALFSVGLVAAWLALGSFSAARKRNSIADMPQISPEQRSAEMPAVLLRQRVLNWAQRGSTSTPLSLILLVMGALPLLIYPFIFLAGIMSLAGDTSNAGPWPVLLIAFVALLSSLAYPIVYLPCAFRAIRRLTKKEPAVRLSAVPLIYLAAVGIVFASWYAVGTALGYS